MIGYAYVMILCMCGELNREINLKNPNFVIDFKMELMAKKQSVC